MGTYEVEFPKSILQKGRTNKWDGWCIYDFMWFIFFSEKCGKPRITLVCIMFPVKLCNFGARAPLLDKLGYKSGMLMCLIFLSQQRSVDLDTFLDRNCDVCFFFPGKKNGIDLNLRRLKFPLDPQCFDFWVPPFRRKTTCFSMVSMMAHPVDNLGGKYPIQVPFLLQGYPRFFFLASIWYMHLHGMIVIGYYWYIVYNYGI